MLDVIKVATTKPIGLAHSHVPLNSRFHHVFLLPTSLKDIFFAK